MPHCRRGKASAQVIRKFVNAVPISTGLHLQHSGGARIERRWGRKVCDKTSLLCLALQHHGKYTPASALGCLLANCFLVLLKLSLQMPRTCCPLFDATLLCHGAGVFVSLLLKTILVFNYTVLVMLSHPVEGRFLNFAIDSINKSSFCEPDSIGVVVLDGSSSLCHHFLHSFFGKRRLL